MDQLQAVREKIKEMLSRVDARPIEDHRSEDEILGYDKNGIPS